MTGPLPSLDVLLATLTLVILAALIAMHDFRNMRIPDRLTMTLAIVGLIALTFIDEKFPTANLVGGFVMVSVFWLMRFGHATLRGKPGLGLGDVKLAGAAAIWLSPWLLSTFLLIACSTCIVYSLAKGLFSGWQTLQQRIPFGPFLCIGLAVVWYIERFQFSLIH